MNKLTIAAFFLCAFVYYLLLNYVFVNLFRRGFISDDYFYLYNIFGYLLFYFVAGFVFKSTNTLLLNSVFAVLATLSKVYLYDIGVAEFSILADLFSPLVGLALYIALGAFSLKLKLVALVLSVSLGIVMFTVLNSDSRNISTKVCLYLEGELDRLVASLGTDIQYKINHVEKCISFTGITSRESARITRALEDVRNLRPPLGRSDSWGSQNKIKLQLLRRNGVEAWIVTYGGGDFVVWDENDTVLAERILEYPDWKKEQYKEMRERK